MNIAILHDERIDKNEINKLILKLEKTYEKEIEIHYFNKKDFYKNKKNPLIASILREGLRLV